MEEESISVRRVPWAELEDISEAVEDAEARGMMRPDGSFRDPLEDPACEYVQDVKTAHVAAKRLTSIRASVLALGRDVTQEDRDMIFAAFEGRCVYCGETGATTLDHMVPIATGGKHEIRNLVPACRACNSKKHVRSMSDWLAMMTDKKAAAVLERIAAGQARLAAARKDPVS